MLELDLIRSVKDHEIPTLGRLYADDLQLFTLENPWLENRPRVSCVPAGYYHVERDTFKGRYPDLRVTNPPAGRSDIEVHAGNRVGDTLGCVLVGYSWAWEEAGPYLPPPSQDALRDLVALVDSRGGEAVLRIDWR